MTQTTTQPRDVFLHRSADPHTAIPDWLATATYLTPEARILAWCILVRQRGPLQPTRDELAEALAVDVRTIDRWLDELRNIGVLSTSRLGRRNVYVIHKRTPDHMIADHMIADHMIADHMIADHPIADHVIRCPPTQQDQSLPQQNNLNPSKKENPIADLAGGGGGDHHHEQNPPPTPTRQRKVAQPCETRLGRFLAAHGFGAAREFDRSDLDPERWIAWVRDQLDRGVGRDRIVHLMRLGAPLEWEPPKPAEPLTPGAVDHDQAEPLTPAPGAVDHDQAELRRIEHLATCIYKDNGGRISMAAARTIAANMRRDQYGC